jgi:5'-3' exonuclease
MKNILIFDMFNTCYRAVGDTSIVSNEVITKSLRFINNLSGEIGIQWNHVYTCFDSDFYWRSDIYKDYKKGRSSFSTKSTTSLFMQQLNFLYTVLENLGFTSLRFHGFEADDIITKICKSFPDDLKVIISTDEDLYQLLVDPNVILFTGTKNNYKQVTQQSFIEKYGITPDKWVTVKSLAGCTSDTIKGIEGIGEKTAIAYLKNETSVTINNKIEEHVELINRNLKLIELPYNTMEHKLGDIPLTEFTFNVSYFKNLCTALELPFFVEDWELNWSQPSLSLF